MEPDHFLDEYDYLWFAGNCHNIEEFYIVSTKYRTGSVCSSHAEAITWAQIQVKVNYFSCKCPLKFVLVHFSLSSGDFKDGSVKMARVMEVVLVMLIMAMMLTVLVLVY